MTILVIAEHDNAQLTTATRNLVSAGLQLSEDLQVLVVGHECADLAKQASRIQGVKKILIADAPCFRHQLAETTAKLIAEIGPGYSHILVCASCNGKNILPRAAALLDVQAIADVIAFESDDIFRRPAYAGNIVLRVQSTDKIKMLTLRTTAFEAAELGGSACEIVVCENTYDYLATQFVKQELHESSRPELGTASVVISGGRAFRSAENFSMLNGLADKLGAAIGASRAAVDEGMAPNDLQVGQTGKIVAPDLYIAIGISGAVQHVAGMKDSKTIVAINNDRDAPIFDIADYGLVADIFEAIPQMEALICE